MSVVFIVCIVCIVWVTYPEFLTWKRCKCSKSGLEGGEGYTRRKFSRKSNTSGGHEVAKDGKHGNAAVLGLDSAESIESLLIGVLQKAQRIEKSERHLSTDSILEGHLQRRRSRHSRGRGECGGGH